MSEKKSTSTVDVADKGPGGSELGRANYRAEQVPDAVIIFAMGWHPTGGYVDFFEQSPLRIYPPQFILRTIPPVIAPDVLTPFAIWAMFGASEQIETVTVHDADGSHEVKVEQVPAKIAAAEARGTWVSGSVVRGGDVSGARSVMAMPTTMATGEEGGGGPTTMATGEEGTAPTTMATGEEGPGPTTMATGEEDTRIATTLAVGEESSTLTTLALNEEHPTTDAIGEEGPQTTINFAGLAVTTFALGEEHPTTWAVGEGPTTTPIAGEAVTTFAVGEESGGTTIQRSSPFGGF